MSSTHLISMKQLFIIAIAILLFEGAHAQVKISSDGSAPNPSAGLEVDFNDRGFLPPRLSSEQRDAIADPAIGLMILNTDFNCLEYYRGGGSWYSMCPKLPTLTTLTATSIQAVTAQSGGEITDDGGATVIARGVCWSTSPTPTLSDSFTSDGLGIGSFLSNISGLEIGTTYYVRAYATNSMGTAYGNEVNFTTVNLPSVTTSAVSSIFGKNATGSGQVNSDGGSAVTSRGVCWSINPVPTTSDNSVAEGSGLGLFSAIMGGLTYSTTYYVRAFATNIAGTAYGNEVLFTTTAGTLVSYTGVGSHTWNVPAGVNTAEYLVVAGGGGGGANHAGGGGGAGGVRFGELSVSGSVSVGVGGGGAGALSTSGTGVGQNGQNSSFGSIVASGGGGGGSEVGAVQPTAGGSGGGGSGTNTTNELNKIGAAGNTPPTAPSQGNSGGNGNSTQPDGYGAAGGGGGAGAPGGNASGNTGGSGGNGIQHSITGSAVYYGGGGGGGSWQTGPGGGAVNSVGGLGGGGIGVTSGSGISGSANTGGGGGGSGGTGATRHGGNGGSGVVHIRY